jgi:hypothetical protein
LKNMGDEQNRFNFTGALYKEEEWFVSLCLDLDVASQGRTAGELTSGRGKTLTYADQT